MAAVPNIFGSHLANVKDHWVAKAYTSQGKNIERAKQHAVVGVHAIRAASEAAITSAGLAALDVHLPTGLDVRVTKEAVGADGKMRAGMVLPVDGAVAALGLVAGVMLAHEGANGPAADFVNIGAAATAVYGFRMTRNFLGKRRVEKSGMVPGYSLQSGHLQALGMPAMSDAQVKVVLDMNKNIAAGKKQIAAESKAQQLAAHGDFGADGATGGSGFGGEDADPIVSYAKRRFAA